MTSTQTAPATTPAAPAPAAPAFDFAKIKVKNAAAPLPKIERKRETKPNAMTPHVAASYEQKKAKQVTVPVSVVGDVVSMIRRAAADAEIGVRVHYPHTVEKTTAKDRETGKEKETTRWVATPDEDGNVTIAFEAKDKAKRKAKDAETAPAAPAAETAPASA